MSATWKAIRKAVDEATRHLHGETRFADPAGARDREQPHIRAQQELLGGSYFLLPPHESGALHWNIARARLHLLIRLLREAVAYGCKFACQIAGREVALIGLFRQASLDRPTERNRGVWLLRSDGFGLFSEDGYQRLRCRASLKGALSSHHFVQHHAERELV